MILRCLKKMYKNKWIYAALTLGLILSIITITVLPMFARASQDRVVRQTLDDYRKTSKIYPTSILYSYKSDAKEGQKLTDGFMDKADKLSKASTEKFDLPIVSNKSILETSKFLFWDSSRDVLKNPKEIIEYKLISIKGIENHIDILKGRIPSSSKDHNGVQELIVHKNIYNQNNLEMDKVYQTTLDTSVEEVIKNLNKPDYKNVKFKIVGIYDIKDLDSDFWMKGIWNSGKQFFLTDIDTHMEILKIMPNRYEYINEYNLDYSKLRYSKLNEKSKNNIIKVFKETQENLKNNNVSISWSVDESAKTIESKVKSTISMMIIILLPLIFMLIVYIFMISTIIANNDSNEISLLKSRGAKLYQIFIPYIVKGIIMGIIGIIIGPIVSKYIVEVMGSTTEFLVFGDQTDLIPYISAFEYILAVVVIIVFIIAMLIPVYITSKKTIVELKRDRFRIARNSLWKKFGLDIIILVFSTYCFYNFVIKEFSNTSASMAKDPLMYLIVSGMCLGIALVFLRIYPFVIKLIFKVGKQLWKPETYYILLYSARNSVKKECIMIFLIFTLSMGIFNMNSARKINKEGEQNIFYSNGADIVAIELFYKSETKFDKNYKKYKEIDGIKNTAKVLHKDEISLSKGKASKITTFMAINPYEFGKVAWMREDLFPNNWYEHLNSLTLEPNAILISNTLVQQGFKVGDTIKVRAPYEREFQHPAGVEYTFDCKIVGSFNYWPGWNSKEKGQELLVVGNYDYLMANTDPMKYDVWIGTEKGKNSNDIHENLIKNKMIPEYFQATDDEVERFKTSTLVQTINGTYTFAFIMTMIVAFIGVVIYWTLSMKERELQFGIIRALGISKRKVYKMIFTEQIMFTVVALIVGTIIGTVMFDIFAIITNDPNIQGHIELPILIEYIASDYIKVLTIVGIMLVVVVTILISYISKLKINQVVKLGED